MSNCNRVIIFGATSAIAEQTARLLVQEGASLVCIGRDHQKLALVVNDLQVRAKPGQIIEAYEADLTDSSNHTQIIDYAVAKLGKLDAALIAHGTLPTQSECEQDVKALHSAFNTNAISVLELCTHLANLFEQQHEGVIAVIGSVAGDRGRKSNYVYGAAKGMVSIFLQGLRNRLHAAGVRVVTIKPGFVDTPMTASFNKSGPLWSTPETIAEGIVHAMRRNNGEVYLPWYWRYIMLIIMNIPEFIFKRLSL